MSEWLAIGAVAALAAVQSRRRGSRALPISALTPKEFAELLNLVQRGDEDSFAYLQSRSIDPQDYSMDDVWREQMNRVEAKLEREYGPHAGLNGDWSVVAYHVGPSESPNAESGDAYIIDNEDDTFSLVRRFYSPWNLYDNPPQELISQQRRRGATEAQIQEMREGNDAFIELGHVGPEDIDSLIQKAKPFAKPRRTIAG
jgi:hypothetical protein